MLLCRDPRHYRDETPSREIIELLQKENLDKIPEPDKVSNFYHFFRTGEPNIIARDCKSEQIGIHIRDAETIMCHLDFFHEMYMTTMQTHFTTYYNRCENFCRQYQIIASLLQDEMVMHLLLIVSSFPWRRVFDTQARHETMERFLEKLSRCVSLELLEEFCQEIQEDMHPEMLIDCLAAFMISCQTFQNMFFKDKEPHLFQLAFLGALMIFKTALKRAVLEKKDFMTILSFSKRDNCAPALVFCPLIAVSCRTCGTLSNLKQCRGCQYVFYCSTQCQRLHWKSHKIDCKTMALYGIKSFFQDDNHPFMIPE